MLKIHVCVTAVRMNRLSGSHHQRVVLNWSLNTAWNFPSDVYFLNRQEDDAVQMPRGI